MQEWRSQEFGSGGDKEDMGKDAYNLQTDVSKMLWSVGVTRFFSEIERGR